MKLPNQLRINKGDYPEEMKPVIDRLASTINPNEEALFNLSNNRISLADNIACVIKDVVIVVNAAGIPQGIAAIDLAPKVKTAIGSEVILAQNQTISTNYPTAQPFISFTQNGNIFEIDHISGLVAGNQYLVRVVVYGA